MNHREGVGFYSEGEAQAWALVCGRTETGWRQEAGGRLHACPGERQTLLWVKAEGSEKW